jgi:hypothetical protein
MLAAMSRRLFFPPCASLRLEADDPLVFSLAETLWSTLDEEPSDRTHEELEVRVQVREERDSPPGDLESRLEWKKEANGYEASIERSLQTRIDLGRASASGWVSRLTLERDPGLVTRLLLETPVGVLLSRRRLQVLHAGAVTGPRGAVVLRGASGAGKSTLVAAGWQAGLGVLGDESLFAAHEDPDDLSATIRDLTLLPDSAALLDLEGRTEPAFSGGERKRRVPLTNRPDQRRATRIATVLLGPRRPGPARLVELSTDEFIAEFRRGGIPEERFTTDPDVIAARWATRGALRIDGCGDLVGAVSLIKSLVV